MTIYVVIGSTGKYDDDSDEWMVRAFRSEARAAEWVTKAAARANEIEFGRKSANEFDSHMTEMNYTWATYRYGPVDLENEVTP